MRAHRPASTFCAIVVCAAAAGIASAGENQPLEFSPPLLASQQQILRALEERADLTFSDTDLDDACSFLRDRLQINVVIDLHALQDVGFDPDVPVTIELQGVSLRSALRLMLEPYGLTYVVEDEVLKITTRERADRQLQTRVYSVADLANSRDEMEQLVEAVRGGVGKEQWDDADPPRAIIPVDKSGALIVRQTVRGHEQVLELLRSLRHVQGQRQNPSTPDPANQ